MRTSLVLLIALAASPGTLGCGSSANTGGDDDGTCTQPAPTEGVCQCSNGGWFCNTCPGGLMPSASATCTPGASCQYEDWEHGCSCTCTTNGRWSCFNETIGSMCPTGDRGTFSAAEPIAALTTPLDEIAPALSGDGLLLVFARPGPGGDLDLWTATRASASEPFSAPTREATVSTTADDTDPALATFGQELVFVSGATIQTSRRVDVTGPWPAATPEPLLAGLAGPDFVDSDHALAMTSAGSVFWSERTTTTDAWQAPVQGVIEGATAVTSAAYRDDGLEIVFASTVSGTSRLYDLVRSSASAEATIYPLDLGFASSVNVKDPELSADGAELVFAADDLGDWNLYTAHRAQP